MRTHKTQQGTFAPLHGAKAADRPIPDSRLIYSRAPRNLGMGRPAQSAAGQP